MPAPYQGPLERIDAHRWRIPKSYQPGMRVDGIIYASSKLIEQIKKDSAPQQVANVATLPGIVKYSLAMPDIHWGYGFCLTKDAKILSNFGFYKPIESFEKDWVGHNLKNIDFNSQKPTETPILKFIKLRSKEIFRLVTKGGYEIKATGDHPLLTHLGMKPIKEISKREKVAIFPFEGVSYERPSNEIIISEEDIKRTLLNLGRKPKAPKFEIILQKLTERNLLPLTYNHAKLPYILKIMGFVLGDASMNFIGKRGDGILQFVGKPQDLEEARKDLKKIGYTPSPIHFRKTKHSRGSNKYYVCYSFFVNASSLVVLLETLRVPRGTKVAQAYRVPKWIFKAPLWQKRLFLASLFGCELRMPHRRASRRGYFNAPAFPMAKREELLRNGKDFLKDITRLLKEFEVNTLYIDKRRKHINRKGEISWALELIISPKPENLLNLWNKIGFEYNFERSFMANVAVQYLRLKLNMLKEKEKAIKITIPQLLKNGLSYQKVAFQLAGNPLTKRFIIDVCWKLNKGKEPVPRIPAGFPLFKDYLKEATEKLEQSGMCWDEIEKIERVPYQDFVYDFTVSHTDHNFIANNFVVSNCIGGVAVTDVEKGGVISPGGVGFDINCGVRLLRTKLFEKDIRPKLKDLVVGLYHNVPAGVGSKGDIRVDVREERKILLKGAGWALSRGYATESDIEHTEEKGAMEGADPSAVSERAYERGRRQSGTLGSGNHFIEIQTIDEIYDEEAAKIFGLEKSQVTVMIHSGSRGFGYQICDDYAKGMVSILSKYGISVPDRQLACAPFNSEDGKRYFGAMKCAANYAWNNRQCLMHLTRLTFEKILGGSWQSLGMSLIYDVAHNIAKLEKHNVDGKGKLLCVHRKGATRAFGPGHPDVPQVYKDIGQPVIIPGDMGTNSYLLVGTQKAMDETFGSTCFTGDTKVLTDTGVIPLKEIYDMYKLGMSFKIASISPNNFTLEWKPVIDVFKRQADVIKISVSQTNRSKLSTLKTTSDHKFAMFHNLEFVFKEISNIIENKDMVCVLDRIEGCGTEHSPYLAYLVGAVFTDGYIRLSERRGQVTFTQKKTLEKLNFISHVAYCFQKIFGVELKEKQTKIGGGIIRGGYIVGSSTDFTCTKKTPASVLLRIYENLHSWILSLDNESTANFLAGVLDGDGTWNPDRHVLDIFNSDGRIVEAIVVSCLKLGILPYISKQRKNVFIIQISERRDLLLKYTKRLKAEPRIRKYGSKFFSVRQLFFNDYMSGVLKWPYLRKSKRNSLMEAEKILTYLTESNTAIDRKGLKGVLSSCLRMHRVKRLENLDKQDVYNINVEDNHNYIVFTGTFIPVVVKNCHGAGRCLSRKAAIRSYNVGQVRRELEEKGIALMAAGKGTIVEEAPGAYKDVNEVVEAVEGAGISKRVCRMRPLGVLKG